MRRPFFFLLVMATALWPLHLSGHGPSSDFALVDSSVCASLLTCSPGQENYELYGHTAIRVRGAVQMNDTSLMPFDVVYNFGVFDFQQPHFTWHFTLGECDYIAAMAPFDRFLEEYAYRGSSVTEQVLALRTYEARRLLWTLDSLSRPENRTYRYHIFRNNCTTRARDIIEASIGGKVIYPVHAPRNTYRTILHEFTAGHPWASEGNDLLLGAAADTLLTERDEQFAPMYLMHAFDSAFVCRGLHAYDPLVATTHEVLAANADRQQAAADALPYCPLSPRVVWWLLLALGIAVAIVEVVRRHIWWPVDAVLMTAQGLAGCLVMFMVLCSEHPTVASNWQVWVLNPVPLCFVYSVVRSAMRHERCVYHPFALAFLAAFVVLYFVLPQDFSELILPLALLLLSRNIVHVVLDHA